MIFFELILCEFDKIAAMIFALSSLFLIFTKCGFFPQIIFKLSGYLKNKNGKINDSFCKAIHSSQIIFIFKNKNHELL